MSKLQINRGWDKYYKHLTRLSSFVLFIFAYAIVITGSTYAFMSFSAMSDSVANGQGGCFEVNYSAQEINHTNLSSTTNYWEGASSIITLSKSSSCKIYTQANIYVNTNQATTAPIDTVPALKYRLYLESNLISEGLITQKGDTLVATVPLTDTTINYTLYVWIDSSMSSGAYDNTIYSGYTYAESSQTSTIEGNYLVNFNTSNTNLNLNKTVTMGNEYGWLPTIEKKGYTFKGWNGKNLFNKDAVPYAVGKYLRGADNVEVNYGDYSIYQIDLKPNTTYTITNSGQSSAPGYVIYNTNNEKVAGANYGNTRAITFTTPSTTSYIRFSVVVNSSAPRYDKDIFQIEEGNSSTSYEPYFITADTLVTQNKNFDLYSKWELQKYIISFNANGGNVNPSSIELYFGDNYGNLPTPTRSGYTFKGWNGKNLFNKNSIPSESSSYIRGDGTLVTNSEFSTYKVNVKPNTTYTITNSGQSTAPGYAIFNSSNVRIAGENYTTRKKITFTTTSDAYYIKFSVVTQSSSYRYDKDTFQLEKGNESTEYEDFYINSNTVVTQNQNHTLTAIWE